MSKPWEELVDVILGLALIAAPWIFGFADIAVARGNSIVVGALVAGIALWGMWTDVAVYKWMDEHNLLQ
jgi:hypothetical protein